MTRNSFALSQLESDQLPEHLTYAAKLRTAAAKAVSETDITAIMQDVVKRAKEGDDRARRFLFDAVLGAHQPLTLKQVNHYHGENPNGNGNPQQPAVKALPKPRRSKPVKASMIDSNQSPLSESAATQTRNIIACLRIQGESKIHFVAQEIGITRGRCLELAQASPDVLVFGDTLSLSEKA